jgi:alanyl-tRNA synthetase
VSGKSLVNADHPQVIEIWNNVFMQFNRLKDGTLQPLPAQHVDTGMGFERLVRVLQEKESNYDTDVFQPLIQFIAAKAGKVYGADEKSDIAMRVMADHVRAISFVIADGQLPANNKAGYVIRRILRRAVRYAYTFLDFKEPFLNQLVPVLASQFVGVFDELGSQQEFVRKVILEEEVSFLRTLATGIQRFENYTAKQAEYLMSENAIDMEKSFDDPWVHSILKDQMVISGDFAFELNDTYGFPIDLTELMAREKRWSVDMEEYHKALLQQKERSRAATTVDTGDWVLIKPELEVEFVGYDDFESQTEIIKYRKVTAKGKDQYQIVLSKTPFYAESGGQVGDTGRLEDHSRMFFVDITNTKKENGVIVHYADSLPEDLEGEFYAVIDEDKRLLSQDNHSATHLLHAALKKILGTHVNQKGSLVNPDYLRFDFSHFAKITDEELAKVEHLVNQKIRENIPLKEQRYVPYEKAISSGVTALFGEKYGDLVRIITFDDHFSKELCGGTHVQATGQIGYFKIISESAVAAGVRRIEAITADKAEAFITNQDRELAELRALLKGNRDLKSAVSSLLEENAKLKKDAEKGLVEHAANLKNDIVHHVKTIKGINLIARNVDLQSADAVKNLAYSIKDMMDELFLVITTTIDDKPGITVMLSENLIADRGLNASNIVRELAKEIQGGGGGQPFYATAGGKNKEGLDAVLIKAEAIVNNLP